MARPRPRPRPRKRRPRVRSSRRPGSARANRSSRLPDLVLRTPPRRRPLSARGRKLAAATTGAAGTRTGAPWVPGKLGRALLASLRVPAVDAAGVVEGLLADARLWRAVARCAAALGHPAYAVDVPGAGHGDQVAVTGVRAVRQGGKSPDDDAEIAVAFRDLIDRLRGMGIGERSGVEGSGVLGTGTRRGVVGRIVDVDVDAEGWGGDGEDGEGDWEEEDDEMGVDV